MGTSNLINALLVASREFGKSGSAESSRDECAALAALEAQLREWEAECEKLREYETTDACLQCERATTIANDRITRENNELFKRAESAEKECERLREKAEWADVWESEKTLLQSALAVKSATVETLNAQVNEKMAALAAATSEVDRLHDEIDVHRAECVALRGTRADLEVALAAAREELPARYMRATTCGHQEGSVYVCWQCEMEMRQRVKTAEAELAALRRADDAGRVARYVKILCDEFVKSSADSQVWKVAKLLAAADGTGDAGEGEP